MADIVVPEVGESITEGILLEWKVQDGDVVHSDDTLFVLETDKITLDVPAESAGRVTHSVEAGATVQVGQSVGAIDTSVKAAPAEPIPERDDEGPAKETPAGLPQAKAKLAASAKLSPAVRRLVDERGLDASKIDPTGKGGRLTKADVLRHLEQRQEEASGKSETPQAPETVVPGPAPVADGQRQTRVKMSMLRQRIAERMVLAQHDAAILTTFNEIDMNAVIQWRARHREAFAAAHGVKLGFMSFFTKAVVEALKAVPEVNAQIQGDEVVYNHYYDIGIAVSTEKGLVVPVVRDADRKSFAEIELAIADLANKARQRTLTMDDISGGTFSISNGGIYGNMLSTPILNPPQSGILGMHAIKQRPVVVENEIVIRPMMYVALSYDHRLVDGREAVTFLKRVVECVENPERLLLEV